jgi:DNA-binding response OmpR family regulator
LPIAALTGENDDDLGIRTLRAGAQDYLCKDDVNQWLLVRSLRHAMERKRLEGQLAERSSILEARIAACTVEADLQAARLRVLAAELSQTEHRERQRLARLFHEHFQQLLVGARFNLGTLSGRLRAPPMDSVVGQVLAALDDAITSAVSF